MSKWLQVFVGPFLVLFLSLMPEAKAVEAYPLLAHSMPQPSAVVTADGGRWEFFGYADSACSASDSAALPDGRMIFSVKGSQISGRRCSGVTMEDIAVYDPIENEFTPLDPFIPGSLNGQIWKVATSESGEIYAAGNFTQIGGVPARGIARWENGAWHLMGEGLEFSSQFGFPGVEDLLVVGNDVYVAGRIISAGGQDASGVARWDGEQWDTMKGGITSTSGHNALGLSLAARQGSVYVGGNFAFAGNTEASRLARWDGSDWHAIPAPGNSDVSLGHITAILAESDALITASGRGGTTNIDGVWTNVASLSNGKWTPILGDSSSFEATTRCSGDWATVSINSIVRFNGELFVGGCFALQGEGFVTPVAKYDGQDWVRMVEGCSGATNCINATEHMIGLSVSDGSLYVAAQNFSNAGGASSLGVLRYTGSQWETPATGYGTLANGLPTVNPHRAIAAYDNQAIVVGSFGIGGAAGITFGMGGVGIWNAALKQWFALGGLRPAPWDGVPRSIEAVATDSSGLVYLGGSFENLGGPFLGNVGVWDGEAVHPLGFGVTGGRVQAIAIDGSDIYMGGTFTGAGGLAASQVARWDGEGWHALGDGLSGAGGVEALAMFNGNLIAGGRFDMADGMPVNRIAKWDGESWQPLGEGEPNGVNNTVFSLAVFENSLYVGGSSISMAGGTEVQGLARWDGQNWHDAGENLHLSSVRSLIVADGSLWAGGASPTDKNYLLEHWDGESWQQLGSAPGTFGFNASSLLATNGRSIFITGKFREVEGHRSDSFAIFHFDRGLTVEPECIVIPDIEEGGAQVVSSTIQNNGLVDVTIHDVLIDESSALEFLIPPDSNSCIDLVLSPGHLCTFDVLFQPTSAGPKRAVALVESSAEGSPHSLEMFASSGVVFTDRFDPGACQ